MHGRATRGRQVQLLSVSELSRVYAERVRSQLFGAGRPSASPKLVVVGGQPGAGQTLATLNAVWWLGRAGDAVAYINGDELRPPHPRYAALVAADNTTAADKTGTDVGWWVERGIRDAAAERFSSVIETTMRQPEIVRRTAEQFTRAGFEFEMRVVFADPELSRLAIYVSRPDIAGLFQSAIKCQAESVTGRIPRAWDNESGRRPYSPAPRATTLSSRLRSGVP